MGLPEVDSTEARIAEWRAHVGRSPAVATADVEELEAHLRDSVEDLRAVGLDADEAFLVAVRRLGALDGLSAEYAREHSDRLWKQLVLAPAADDGRPRGRLRQAVLLAVGAGAAVQVPRLLGAAPERPADLVVHVLLVLLFLLAFVGLRGGDGPGGGRGDGRGDGRRLGARGWLAAAAPFALGAAVAVASPWAEGSSTELLVALHLPVVLWFAVGHALVGGDWRSPSRRMDVVRFTGEWVVYYALIALGGVVLVGLTVLLLQPAGDQVVEQVLAWLVPSGAAGAVVVAAWLVEAKQSVVENMAPVLTAVFTPLFALVLTASAVVYALTGLAAGFDRDLLLGFDLLLVVVLGLVLYSLSAQEPSRRPGALDWAQLAAVVSALVLDALVLVALLGRVGDLGWTPNRVAALGLNAVLLVDLVVAAVLAVRFLAGRTRADRLARWQTTYLPVLGGWAAVVVLALPPLFGYR
ncbi:permease prefix domain 1-containing protein [uncultured Pseudokineococcus sp.]|uniref:permease prefix domain 1-containing protein n=1 Tax=uncultured Pseudokineococcus sp. TaxID=1642928 RepID=UPI00260DEADC|nr:permease prefix domain 1-containing protein [uncultured Pseudokineococcus sp.]